MNLIFHPSMNTIARASIVGVVLLVGALGGAIFYFVQSPFMTNVGVAVEQDVPFSHLHHVRQLGLDCRYCHTSVEDSSFAGIPPTETCMTCHSQVWTEAPMLQPVRDSWQNEEPLQWNRVHNLSGFVYFNHSAHVNNGVGCESCHGRVDNMPLAWKENTLQMGWCLQCHRDPAQYLRPNEEVITMGYEVPEGTDQRTLGTQLIAEYEIEVGRLDDCSICHR
jgi:hypothetical protein